MDFGVNPAYEVVLVGPLSVNMKLNSSNLFCIYVRLLLMRLFCGSLYIICSGYLSSLLRFMGFESLSLYTPCFLGTGADNGAGI